MPASPGNGPLKPIGADGSLRPLLPTAFLAELRVGREEGEGERGVGEDGRGGSEEAGEEEGGGEMGGGCISTAGPGRPGKMH